MARDKVPPEDDAGAGVEAVRVRKDGPGLIDVVVEWDAASGAERYNVWRGTLAGLRGGAYDHAVDGPLLCNRPSAPTEVTMVLEATWTGTLGSYYLVNAEATCPDEPTSAVQGSWGHADPDRDGLTEPSELRPGGLTLDPSCLSP